MKRVLLLGVCLVSLASLPACSVLGIATGAAATLGVAASQEGGVKRAKNDFLIQAEINDLWFKYNVEMFSKLDMTVQRGRVLLTGVVQDPEHRVEAVRLAWQPEGVEQVINEIQVAEGEGFKGFARDTWISGRLRAALTFDGDVQSINYNIDTVQGVVYLMGVAQNQAELSRVIEIARTISNVKQVVSYVKMAGAVDESIEIAPVQNSATGTYIVPVESAGAPVPLTNNPVGDVQPLSEEDRVIVVEPLNGGF